ncbi:hypothetical protein PVAP13_4KG111405 [Panicum virgatum]|uniref:Uncharacterized protein n=1 Tax=Panicum virgatum TaxID=38727 RepID=A0A8T0TLN6_PANVG|nr:hypothetical protein PVAP13_4KG111405 [Panicum virgatum]
MHVLFKGTHWLRHLAKLQQNEEKSRMIIDGCRHLETVAFQVFQSFGWPYVARISL